MRISFRGQALIHRHSIALLLVCALCLAGCAQNQSTPTPTPVQRQLVTFIASRLHAGFTLSIDADWFYKVTDTGLILANASSLLGTGSGVGELPAGALAADITLLTPDYLLEIGARNAAGILDYIGGAPAQNSDAPVYSPVKLLELRGRDSAQLLANVDASETLLLALALDDHYLLAVVAAPNGGIQAQAAALSQLFASAQLQPVEQ